jgi:hypothetical protein
MGIRTQLWTSLLLIFSIAQCSGQKDLSSHVDFKSRSDEPIVINGDITLGTGDDKITIKHPWFIWNYHFKNKTTYRLVIPTATFHVSTRRNGVKVEKDYVIDPGKFCSSSETRSYLAIVEPTGTAPLDDYSGSKSCDIITTTQRVTPPAYENWYIEDLGDSDNQIYTVEVTATGWFEDTTTGEIKERYEGYDFLITR